ncbi:MAG: hypothetical protein HKP30_16370 [Myxococcales bacterium]|nr:hypothetical protein [Myxococcales bacterium]
MRKAPLWLAAPILAASALAASAAELPPSAFRLIASQALQPGYLDATPLCRIEQSGALSQVLLSLRAIGNPERASKALRGALAEDLEADTDQRICAHLESARLALKLGRAPDARAALRRAERIGKPGAGFIAITAAFHRAEAFAMSGERDAARALYLKLRESPYGDVAVAARLRLLAFEIDSEDAEAAARARTGLGEALEAARVGGLDVSPWAPLAAEAAVEEGALREAHRWLAIAERIEDRAGVASLRKGDVLVALERRNDARQVFERIRSSARLPAARELARVRLAEIGVPAPLEERIAELERAARAVHPAVSGQARDTLAVLLLEERRLGAALGVLSALGHDGAPQIAKPRFAQTLERALRAATADTLPCTAVIEAVGGRRALYIRIAPEPDTLLRVGDCFGELGMPEAALEIYRGLARRFPLGPNQLALRIARASFDLGNHAALRAALSAQEHGSDEEVSWRWLETRLALVEGRNADAARGLLALLERDDLPASLRVEAEKRLALLDSAELDPQLRLATLLDSLHRKAPGSPTKARATGWLAAADALAGEGREDAAGALYGRALALLPAGSRRERARYAAAVRAGSPQATREALAARTLEDGRRWSRLADLELELIELRAAARRTEAP